MRNILEKLKCQHNRQSTKENYLRIWRRFNKFVIKLDNKPKTWEDRVYLFVAHLIDNGAQSSSVKSYISAIKSVLCDDGYIWKDERMLLSTLTKSCKLVNDTVRTRLPIQCGLLELILFEMQRFFKGQQLYLETMYSALFLLGYYGLMRIGELCYSEHALKASNVHIACNKDKILMILYTSKTHGYGNLPQKIKITANANSMIKNQKKRHFCPFQAVRKYISIRGGGGENYDDENEQFFVLSDKSPVTQCMTRNLLKILIDRLGLNAKLYGVHSLRIGRSSELIKFGYSVDELKRAGRWSSNAVYRYIR